MTPIAAIKPEKKQVVETLTQDMKSAKSIIMVDYAGMGMSALSELRSRLFKASGKVVIAKNTLARLAGKKAGISESAINKNILSGQTALIFLNKDAIAPIQILGKFINEFEIPRFKAGIVENKFQDEASLIAISKLPAREVLAGQAVGAIAGPIYGITNVLQANLQKLIYILKEAESKD